MLAAIAQGLLPPRVPVDAPAWLHPHHRPTLGAVVAALDLHGGALVADPVGSGKTYVALAAAHALGVAVTAVVPAILATQWRTACATLGIAIQVRTHEQLSRQPGPAFGPGLVIVDESHRFREPTTRRYEHLADALLQSHVLLLSATPVVNRLADLSAQLLLAVRDDTLAMHGVASIRDALADGLAPAALAHLVVRAARPASQAPRRSESTRRAELPAAWAPWLDTIEALQLSASPAIAALVRGSLLRALASSPASLVASLRRYRLLLSHHADAIASGRTLPRGALQRATNGLDPQLMLWALLPEGGTATDLALADLAPLEAMLNEVRLATPDDDPRLGGLRALLDDGVPTAVFSTHRATVRWLRDGLGTHGIAWCTGQGAGIGRMTMRRDAVLDLFRTEQPVMAKRTPAVLVASDVAAEGLDLRRLRRVVHFDLPWTAARLEQRTGRALRSGTPHGEVSVIRLDPPVRLEARLRVLDRLVMKAALPGQIGLGSDGMVVDWRRLLGLAEDVAGSHPGVPGVACMRGPQPGVLAMTSGDGATARVAWIDATGRLHEDPVTLHTVLEACAADPVGIGSCAAWPLPPGTREALQSLVAHHSGAALSSLWDRPMMSPLASRFATDAAREARRARQDRESGRLAACEAAHAFAARGHTAGEHRLLARVVTSANPLAVFGATAVLPRGHPPAENTRQLRALLIVLPAPGGS